MGGDDETVAHLRHVAFMSRRSNPPRCHPFTILSLILSGGLIFIGLTMTIIANWPGVTSVGNNPLKIAGPIILCIGGICFIASIFIACFLNKREAKRWTQNINRHVMTASKQILDNTEDKLKSEQTALLASRQTYEYQPPNSKQYNYQYKESTEPRNTENMDEGVDETDVPTPVRLQKKKRVDASASSSKTTTSPLNNTLSSNNTQTQIDESLVLLSGDAEPAEEVQAQRKKKTKKTKTRNESSEDIVETYTTVSQTRTVQTKVVETYGTDETEGQVPGSEEFRLRLNIKSVPGTGIYIQQGRHAKESDL